MLWFDAVSVHVTQFSPWVSWLFRTGPILQKHQNISAHEDFATVTKVIFDKIGKSTYQEKFWKLENTSSKCFRGNITLQNLYVIPPSCMLQKFPENKEVDIFEIASSFKNFWAFTVWISYLIPSSPISVQLHTVQGPANSTWDVYTNTALDHTKLGSDTQPIKHQSHISCLIEANVLQHI